MSLRGATYDPVLFLRLQEATTRYNQAQDELQKYEPIARRRGEVQKAMEDLDLEIDGRIKEAGDLRHERVELVVSEKEQALVQKQEEEAAAKERDDDDAWLQANNALIKLGEQLEQEKSRLAAMIRAEERTWNAERSAAVVERVQRLLERVLSDFAAEARPRLTELVEGWMHPLLTRRFQKITLDDSYQLQADNGSGLHQIDHFSGGEQTMLAIMLRAAISLFCRERAGFDTGFLILDEIFGDQDAQRRNLLVQFLDEIKEQYHQIIVVNHIDEISGQLDTILQVTPISANESCVEVLS